MGGRKIWEAEKKEDLGGRKERRFGRQKRKKIWEAEKKEDLGGRKERRFGRQKRKKIWEAEKKEDLGGRKNTKGVVFFLFCLPNIRRGRGRPGNEARSAVVVLLQGGMGACGRGRGGVELVGHLSKLQGQIPGEESRETFYNY